MKEKTGMLANEERELKKYILEQLKENGRTIFEVRTNMIKIGANFGEKGKRCELCGKEETTEHIFKCCWSQDHIQRKMYKDIREDEERNKRNCRGYKKNIKGKRTTKRNIKRMRSRSPPQRGARYILVQPLLLLSLFSLLLLRQTPDCPIGTPFWVKIPLILIE